MPRNGAEIRRSYVLASAPPGCAIGIAAFMLVFDARGSDHAPSDEAAAAPSEQSEEKKTGGGASRLEDDTIKRALVELAGYTDSDHVMVWTPSVAMSVENLSGASLSASYLVDVVSAASIDIVSTASTRSGWGEVRQAGTLGGQYKPHDLGVRVGGSVSSEPDYLSYGGYATAVKDFDDKNWTLTLGYGYSHDTAGRCGVGGACTPFDVFSRNLERGAFTAGLAWVVAGESLASVNVDLVVENGLVRVILGLHRRTMVRSLPLTTNRRSTVRALLGTELVGRNRPES